MANKRRRVTRPGRRRADPATTRDADDAFVALLIAAMDASGHVSAEEAARAHNIIWSMRRFRHRSGERVGRMIERVKALIEAQGAAAVLESSARKIPARLRLTAFALAVDLTLADGRMERTEARFLRALAADLGLKKPVVDAGLEVMRIKNSAVRAQDADCGDRGVLGTSPASARPVRPLSRRRAVPRGNPRELTNRRELPIAVHIPPLT
jgi:tellurite resistance protein